MSFTSHPSQGNSCVLADVWAKSKPTWALETLWEFCHFFFFKESVSSAKFCLRRYPQVMLFWNVCEFSLPMDLLMLSEEYSFVLQPRHLKHPQCIASRVSDRAGHLLPAQKLNDAAGLKQKCFFGVISNHVCDRSTQLAVILQPTFSSPGVQREFGLSSAACPKPGPSRAVAFCYCQHLCGLNARIMTRQAQQGMEVRQTVDLQSKCLFLAGWWHTTGAIRQLPNSRRKKSVSI